MSKDPMLVHKYDMQMESRKWLNEIPYINFPSDWEVQVCPPFAGATVRFRVRKGESRVSVYLDCYNHLGYFDFDGTPYWEIYPYDDDIWRCGINEIGKLIKHIEISLTSQSSNP